MKEWKGERWVGKMRGRRGGPCHQGEREREKMKRESETIGGGRSEMRVISRGGSRRLHRIWGWVERGNEMRSWRT
jgi:hypothetical protein